MSDPFTDILGDGRGGGRAPEPEPAPPVKSGPVRFQTAEDSDLVRNLWALLLSVNEIASADPKFWVPSGQVNDEIVKHGFAHHQTDSRMWGIYHDKQRVAVLAESPGTTTMPFQPFQLHVVVSGIQHT